MPSVWIASQSSRRRNRRGTCDRPTAASVVVPGGRFSGLIRCGTPVGVTAGSPETGWVAVSGTGGGGVGSTGSASADGAVIMNAVITPSVHNPADPLRLTGGMVTERQAVVRMPVCVQSRHNLWNPAMHQRHPQLHRTRNFTSPTNSVSAVEAADGEAQLADGRSPLAFMAADRSSAMPHRRGIQEIHCVLVAAIKERTALKRQASGYGTKFGRPRKVKDRSHITTARRMKADGHTGKDIAKYLGVSRATLYRYLNEEKRRLKRASRSACLASPAPGWHRHQRQPLRARCARGRCRRRLLAWPHLAWPHLAVGVVVVVTAMVAAVVAAQAPADEEPGEEDHRDDEQDPGHDANPRQRLVEPVGAAISVVVPWRRLNGVRHPGHGV